MIQALRTSGDLAGWAGVKIGWEGSLKREGGRRVPWAANSENEEPLDARKDLSAFAVLAKECGLYAQGEGEQ